MHALPSHPRNPLVAGLLALLLALLVMLAAAPELGTLDLSLGGGTSTDVAPVAQPAPVSAPVESPSAPAWVTDPLASPIQTLAGQR